MNEVLRAAAHLPDAFVRLPPRLRQIVQNDRPQGLSPLRWRHACLQGLKHRVRDLAVDVELQLLGRAVADSHRLRILVAGQPGDGQLQQPALAPTPYMIWAWIGLPATARMSQSRKPAPRRGSPDS